MMIKEDFLPTKVSKLRCSILVLMVIVIYCIENSSIPSIIGSQSFNYIIKPILWGIVVLTIWLYPRANGHALLKLRGLVNLWAFNFAIIYIACSVIVGIFIEGLGKSPYAHSPIGILKNVIFVGSALIGREIFRGYLVNRIVKKENYKVFILITLFTTFISISFNSYINISGHENLVEFIAESLAPEFSKHLLATYLVFLGGPLTSIIYIGTVDGFHWLSPILPDFQWITTALIGVLCPIFFMMSVQNIYLDASKQINKSKKDNESPLSWLLVSVVSIGIVWFSVGVFPVYPSVIATGSMEPLIKPGDVILVKKVKSMDDINDLKINDVIQFERGNILISHRVIEIIEDNEGKRYKTKGDNNSGPDQELVSPNDIRGKIVFVVPKIGWPTLLIKSEENIPLKGIVF
ncbi:signal peptidase I [Sporosalibacterium faouarense]|uniref:signal peptidase I n=1 Tax=Sporosalibacterium faouarense TaxID=516123 RepID=UPI00141C7AB9|nr:signal peptidase I [Sporosalibacterium faouarense]MTI48859.1 signal peptidase I [Bacillota bacterium]